MGPYLLSVIVRDAAVTSWLNVASAPIEGEIQSDILKANQSVGEDGVIVSIRNDHLSRREVDHAVELVDWARARVEVHKTFLANLKRLNQENDTLRARYAETFRSELDAQIKGLNREIEATNDRLTVLRRIAERKAYLAVSGRLSQIMVDEELVRVSDLELEIAEFQETLDLTQVRREATEKGVFITPDGQEPLWVRGLSIELELEIKKARLSLRDEEAGLMRNRTHLAAAQLDFQRRSEASIKAPPGSIIWSDPTAPGEIVKSGQRVAIWIDCSILMIDVPVADAEAALIRPGHKADVVLEGETKVRSATVLFVRGSASTLGLDDLAALAKGRGEGVAQVLLEFSEDSRDFEDCPLGRAAFVDFLDIGLIDVIRARLRL